MQGLKSSSSMGGIAGQPPVMGMLKGREIKASITAFGNPRVIDVEISATMADLMPSGAKAALMEPYAVPAPILKAIRAGRFDRNFLDDPDRLTLSLRAMCDPDMGEPSRLDIAVLTRIAVDSILPVDLPPADRLRRASHAAARLARQGYTIPQSTVRRLRAARSERGFHDEP